MTSSATRLGIGAVIVLLIIGGGIGAYFLFFNKSGSPSEPTTSSTSTTSTTTSTTSTTSTIAPPTNGTLHGTLFVNTGTGKILQIDLSTEINKTLVEDETYGITTFDYCPKKKTVFYGTTELNQPVLFSNGDGQKIELSKSKSWIKTAVAVDSVTDKIYVVDGQDGKVYVLDLQNDHYKEVLQDLEDPMDIVLDPHHGLMFILQSSAIIQVSMDGTDYSEIVVERGLRSIAIDHEREEIYYAFSNRVGAYSYAKNEDVDFNVKLTDNIVGLAAMKARLYLVVSQADPLPDVLMTCELKDHTCVLSTVAPMYPSFMQSIKVHDETEAVVKSPCEVKNGDCQHLCLLSSNHKKYSCSCHEGWKLSSDMKNCEQVN